MKYRIIERNDGYFEFEYGSEDTFGSGQMLWHRLNYMKFATEEDARRRFYEINTFVKAADVKRVVEEIEI